MLYLSQLPAQFSHFSLQRAYFLLGAYLRGDVALNTDVVRQLVRFVVHGRDGQLIPEQAPVLAVVAQHLAAGAAFTDRLADGCHARLVMIFALKKTAVLIEDIVGAIAGQALEGGVGVNQDAFSAFLLGDDDAIVGMLDHQLQEFRGDHRAHLLAFHMRYAQRSFCAEGIGAVCCMMDQGGSPQKVHMGLEWPTTRISPRYD